MQLERFENMNENSPVGVRAYLFGMYILSDFKSRDVFEIIECALLENVRE